MVKNLKKPGKQKLEWTQYLVYVIIVWPKAVFHHGTHDIDKDGGVYMKGRINNKLGEIQISSDVIALYAGMTAVECFGIVGMAAISMKDGLVKLLKRESISHGINVEIEDNRISLDFHVIVSYGVSICAVADNLIANVKYKVEAFTGMEVEHINIYVEGVRVID